MLLLGAHISKARGLHTSLDPVWDASGRWERLLAALPHLDLVAPSVDEGRAISGEREPAAVAGWLRARGSRAVVLKLGPEGCYASGEGFEGFVEPFAVRAVDGTGAGDAFVAGLLFGRLSGWPLDRSLNPTSRNRLALNACRPIKRAST